MCCAPKVCFGGVSFVGFGVMADRVHWNNVYGRRSEDALTWFEHEATLSLGLLEAFAPKTQSVVDVGGGASRFVDGLLQRGHEQVAVLDLSSEALNVSKMRLGADSAQVTWITADVTRWVPKQTWAFWHDRAVFHFLTDAADRAAYVSTMLAALAPDGHAMIATFAPDGPETCSDLPVQRWSASELAQELERFAPGAFVPVAMQRHVHLTPKGRLQPFTICVFKRTG